MTAPNKKRGCLGCSVPVVIAVAVVVLAIVIIGFLSGSLGKSFVNVSMPSWLSISAPEPHLPAPVLFHIFGLPITNTMIATWITVIFLVLFTWLITRRMKLVPGRLQAFLEYVLGFIYDFCVSVAGEKNGRRFFPVVCTIFLFVICNAWFSLIPGFASLEVHLRGQTYELLRGANTDVNTPLAVALISFAFVAYFGITTLKFGYVRQYFNFGPLFKSIGGVFKGKIKIIDIFSGVVGVFVGMLELLSMLMRIISFTFRLFGNMTAGEILLAVAAFLIPLWLTIPFYGLELLIGFVQALIFSGLTLVFVAMAVTSEHEASTA